MRSWGDPTFQGNQVADQVREFLGAQSVAIRRHRGAVDEGMLTQGRLLKGAQLFFGVEELHGEQVVIEEPAGDLGALARDDAERPMVRQHRRRRIHDRSLEIGGAPQSAHVGEIGAGPRPVAVDAMAARAAALAFENRLARVLRSPGADVLRVSAAMVRRYATMLPALTSEMLFGGIPVFGMPVLMMRTRSSSVRGAPELTAAQVHAGDAVTVRPVTRRAARQKEPPAVLHVRGGVFVLRRQRGANHREARSKSELAGTYLPEPALAALSPPEGGPPMN